MDLLNSRDVFPEASFDSRVFVALVAHRVVEVLTRLDLVLLGVEFDLVDRLRHDLRPGRSSAR